MQYNTLIGILTVRRFDLLQECLRHVLANTPDLDSSFLVIANNSTEPAYITQVDALASEYGIATINHRRGRGTSAAWNAMTRICDCRQVAIISDDVIVHPGWMDGMDWVLSFPQTGVSGIRAWNGQNEWERRNTLPFPPSLMDAQPIIYPCGFLLMYLRERFEEINGFDENIWMGLEEVDFSIRMMQRGYGNYQVGIRNDVYKFGNHYGFASGYYPEQAAPELREIARRNIEYFKEKHQTEWPLTKEFEEKLKEECAEAWTRRIKP